MESTRSNLFKTPSFSYKKATSISSVLQNLRGSPITNEEQTPIENNKRDPPVKFRRQKRKHEDKEGSDDESDTSFSHQGYIERIREEVKASNSNLDISPNVLVASDSSHETGITCEELQRISSEDYEKDVDTPSFDHAEGSDQVKKKHEQRFPVPGEPACVLCGRYGEYICDKTGDDICSVDCKNELLKQLDRVHIKTTLQIPQLKDTSDFDWQNSSKTSSNLGTYRCWKCQRPGHLGEDCLVQIVSSIQTYEQEPGVNNRFRPLPRDLSALYKRCRQIGMDSSSATCNTCRNSKSLALCLDCNMAFCDSAGHLNAHMNARPYHQRVYSYKLKRLVKCCKSTCNVTEIKDLLVCRYCLDKAFEKFYDMYTAMWRAAGLKMIWGSICCDEHFTWCVQSLSLSLSLSPSLPKLPLPTHVPTTLYNTNTHLGTQKWFYTVRHRMNCCGANIEGNAHIMSRCMQDGSGQISDFIF